MKILNFKHNWWPIFINFSSFASNPPCSLNVTMITYVTCSLFREVVVPVSPLEPQCSSNNEKWHGIFYHLKRNWRTELIKNQFIGISVWSLLRVYKIIKYKKIMQKGNGSFTGREDVACFIVRLYNMWRVLLCDCGTQGVSCGLKWH